MSPFPPWLSDSHSGDDLLEAIRKTADTKPESKHTHPDTCERCGGLGCDECRYCAECKRRR
jgi:hypothetical protein